MPGCRVCFADRQPSGRLYAERRGRHAVCRAVAVQMANGALAHSSAHVSVAITGVAGNPVGKVCIAALEREESVRSAEFDFGNPGRDDIRRRAVLEAELESIGVGRVREREAAVRVVALNDDRPPRGAIDPSPQAWIAS